jgi:hypothetical protein
MPRQDLDAFELRRVVLYSETATTRHLPMGTSFHRSNPQQIYCLSAAMSPNPKVLAQPSYLSPCQNQLFPPLHFPQIWSHLQ